MPMADQSVIHKAITARDLAGLIASHLAAKGIDVTLVGGTRVSIYSDNFYQSDDLDFVDRYFEHPDSPFVVEFPPGPLSVGDDPVRNWSTLSTPLGTFTLITPEDCIKDRLAAYFPGMIDRLSNRPSGLLMIRLASIALMRLKSGLSGKEKLINLKSLSGV